MVYVLEYSKTQKQFHIDKAIRSITHHCSRILDAYTDDYVMVGLATSMEELLLLQSHLMRILESGNIGIEPHGVFKAIGMSQ